MKYIPILILIFVLTVTASAQRTRDKKETANLVGTVSGEIVIKEASGMGSFKCSSLIVGANRLGGGGWTRAKRAYGNFAERRCRFAIPAVPAGEPFLAVLNAQMPSCDQKVFKPTTSFPMTLKNGEALIYNFEVTTISCVLLK